MPPVNHTTSLARSLSLDVQVTVAMIVLEVREHSVECAAKSVWTVNVETATGETSYAQDEAVQTVSTPQKIGFLSLKLCFLL